MEKNKIINNDWITILKFKEIHDLLNYEELSNLSLVNKKIYYKAKSLLQSKIYISSGILKSILENNYDWNYEENIEISSNLLEKFKYSVKSICKLVRSANIIILPRHPQIYSYLDTFINLESLRFCHPGAKVNLSSLNYTFNKLPNLKELKFIYVNIHCDESGGDIKILFPSTLTKLSINGCIWSNYYEILRDNSLSTPILGPYSVLETQKFPQLVSFEYSISKFNDNFNPVSAVLKNSPKLKILNLDVKFLNQEIFTLISKSASLKFIGFKNNDGADVIPEDFSSSTSYLTVKSICYPFVENSSRSLPNIELLLSLFPNLEKLSLSYERPFIPHFKRILKNLTKLQKFELFNFDGYYDEVSLKVSNSTITHLTLFNFKFSQIDFQDFEDWTKLKSIKLKFDEFFIRSYNYTWQEDFIKVAVGRNWRVFSYSNYIRFYRK